jgi:hypothetical protein
MDEGDRDQILACESAVFRFGDLKRGFVIHFDPLFDLTPALNPLRPCLRGFNA